MLIYDMEIGLFYEVKSSEKTIGALDLLPTFCKS